ncbi:uncharacterized protein C8R40DRAFT_1057128 [Lentinula edodes]|uniref:uncharacterized protein n=1 Tax=Lentinula edodes TaxID=5353 RepID=UPI001E8D44B0|nr:uncharacterized protein C8R40DRAFT_1057128 [Lentinula edodes]KAH7870451.1 hypothetical protein C8R40DRAFT_1057128 [Lentinula edodes]
MALVTVFNGDPNVNDINHILDWIVDLLLPFWDGIYFTQTCSHPLGRVVRGILIPIVCDVVGAHHVSGFGSHSHKLFCTQCLLLKSDINNIDMATWPRRNLQEHQLRAQEYHKATSDEERDHIVNTYGVRWTALLRLPYWNPIAYTVIDGMHLCKGLAETHVRGVLGIEGDAKPKATLKSKFKPPAALLRSLWDGIRKAPENLSHSIMEEVRTDIQRSILPTWIQPAPLAWGTPSGGKLSADHWKVICTIHLVVTLIRVWAYGNDGTKMPLLQNFLHLVRALQILNLRSTSKQLSEAYTSEMLQYLTTLKELFPNWEFVPNQHYSLHMGEFLQTMGPLHARDTSAFERVNHELQDTTTNRRIGGVL